MSDKSFCFLDFDWLGFDVDHTLVQYRLDNLDSAMVHSCLELFPQLETETAPFFTSIHSCQDLCPDLFVRDVVIDVELGNILKVDFDNHIISAYHGSQPLPPEHIAAMYPESRLTDFVPGLPPVDRDTSRYCYVDTFFERGIVALFGHCVNCVDSQNDFDIERVAPCPAYRAHLQAIFRCFGSLFRNYDQGPFFPDFSQRPEYYLRKTPDHVKRWFESLRARGVRLFVCSNSLPRYVHASMSYCYGPDWQSHFDLILTWAGKPAFFQRTDLFQIWDAGTKQLSPLEGAYAMGDPLPKPAPILYGGSFEALGPLLNAPSTERAGHSEPSPASHPRICYVGDNLTSDVACTHRGGWSAVGLVEELQLYESTSTNASAEQVQPILQEGTEECPWDQGIRLGRSALGDPLIASHANGDEKALKKTSALGRILRDHAGLYAASLAHLARWDVAERWSGEEGKWPTCWIDEQGGLGQ
eukprot:gnl/Trimastix_PCT/4636.p1 GENE.gnl/Trimastix_PCT/4636~~gnl/Trimastix_PCT/4636.p1  ORF type:complete len:471 (+),score=30.90 gnl/Trimastix_PCT/4636:50-1462(+)